MSTIVYDLNDENFMIYAIKHYDSPNCFMHEFEEDLKRVKYIKRLIGRYLVNGELKERLILNHIIVLSNVFGVEFTTRLLFYKAEPEQYSVLKAFLLHLQYLPKNMTLRYIRGVEVNLNEIMMDQTVIDHLRKI